MISSIQTKLFATLFMAYEKTQGEEKLIQSTQLITCTMAQSRMTKHTFHPSCALGRGAPLSGNLPQIPLLHSEATFSPAHCTSLYGYCCGKLKLQGTQEKANTATSHLSQALRMEFWACSIWHQEMLRVKGLPSPKRATEWQLTGTTWRLISYNILVFSSDALNRNGLKALQNQ